MFLSKEAFEELKKIFIPPKPINFSNEEGELKNMISFYKLEDYIKEHIYDKKYPGILPNIEPDIYSREDYTDEEENEQENSPEKENDKNINKNEEKINNIEKKYKIISNLNDIITFSENYSTDDEDEYDALQLLNENREEGNEYGWILSINKEKMKIYYKIVKLKDEKGKDVDSLFFYAESIINYPANKVNQYINDFNFRKEFDEMYKKGKILNEKTIEENNLKIIEGYYYMKMPFMFTDRDFVTRKKIWSDYNNRKNCFLINIKSIEHSDYPEKDKPVRGKFINRSAYICPDGDDKCKLYLCTCFDMKINIGVSMMKTKGSEGQGQWIEKLVENIKKFEG